MAGINDFIGQHVELEISGKTFFHGILIDCGLDIIVLFDGQQFLYIPLLHIHNIRKDETNEDIQLTESDSSILDNGEQISYRKILTNAKGRFVELYVTGNKSIHGYITSILNDYFVFYSPVHKTMLISLNHLKWLIPYNSSLTPYTLNNEDLPVQPTKMPVLRTYEEQLKKLVGKLVVFDMGDRPNKVGLLKSVDNNIIELIIANGETIYWKLLHLKSVHLP
jgi:hypothetical protein